MKKAVLNIIIGSVFVILAIYEAYGEIYTQIANGKTLANILPYDTMEVPYQACVSRCHYDSECLSFDFTPGSPLGVCNFYDVLFIMGNNTHQLVNKPGTMFYSSLPKEATTATTTTTTTTTTMTTTTQPPPPKDCADLYNRGSTQNGVYQVKVLGIHDLSVYCNMQEDGGGWMVFQKRFDMSLSFHKTWQEYKDGFGNPLGEHWLGNKWLNLLTKSETYDYYVVAKDNQGNTEKKKMLGVTVENEDEKYKIQFEAEGDGPPYGKFNPNSENSNRFMDGMKFSTVDQDNNPTASYAPCTQYGGLGGWWYQNCFEENMNGASPVWRGWKGGYTGLAEAMLMIRPRSFQ